MNLRTNLSCLNQLPVRQRHNAVLEWAIIHAEEAMANQVARCQAEVGTIPYTYIWYIEHGLLKELDEAMHREVEASLKRGNL